MVKLQIPKIFAVIVSLILIYNYIFLDVRAEIEQGEELGKPRNPFIAFYEVDKDEEQEQIVEVVEIMQEPQIEIYFNLTGILHGRQTFAIINDGIVKVGDIIYGYTIKHIEKDFVIAEREGEEVTLQLLTR